MSHRTTLFSWDYVCVHVSLWQVIPAVDVYEHLSIKTPAWRPFHPSCLPLHSDTGRSARERDCLIEGRGRNFHRYRDLLCTHVHRYIQMYLYLYKSRACMRFWAALFCPPWATGLWSREVSVYPRFGAGWHVHLFVSVGLILLARSHTSRTEAQKSSLRAARSGLYSFSMKNPLSVSLQAPAASCPLSFPPPPHDRSSDGSLHLLPFSLFPPLLQRVRSQASVPLSLSICLSACMHTRPRCTRVGGGDRSFSACCVR